MLVLVLMLMLMLMGRVEVYNKKSCRGFATAFFVVMILFLRELAVDFLHVSDEVENFVRVTDFIVIPRNYLNEGRSQLDTCLSVEDRGEGAAEEVRRNDSVFGVAEDAFEFAFRSFFHSSADFLVSSGFSEVNGEVNNRNVEGGDAH